MVGTSVVLLVFDRGSTRWWMAGLSVAALIASVAWGGARMRENALTREGTPIRVGLVQGNVAQDEKWESARASGILQTYIDLSRQAASRGARFIIWPESALPFFFQDDPVAGDGVRRLAFDTRILESEAQIPELAAEWEKLKQSDAARAEKLSEAINDLKAKKIAVLHDKEDRLLRRTQGTPLRQPPQRWRTPGARPA